MTRPFRSGDVEATANAMRRENFYLFLRHMFPVVAPGQSLSGDDYLETLCFELKQAAETPGGRLMVTMPPRYLKSIAASFLQPAWLIGRDPKLKIIVASYGEKLTQNHARMFGAVVASRRYQRVFPHMSAKPKVNSVTEFTTAAGGGRRTATVGGAITGIGADLIIIDDIMKASDASSEAAREEARRYHDETLYSRLNNKAEGSIIVVQQRLHQDDLIAHLLEKGTYRHLNLPALAERPAQNDLYNGFTWSRDVGDPLAPGRENTAALDIIRGDVGEAAFRTQYQQDPASAGSPMLDFFKVRVLDKSASDIRILKTVQAWDTAVKDGPNCDYSVGMTFGWDDGRWVLLDVQRRRMNFADLKACARKMYEKWQPELAIVEDSANGSALYVDLRGEGILIKPFGVSGSKEERFSVAAEWLESGKIALLRNTDYFEDLRRELLGFPQGRFDDQVDTISLFVRRARIRAPMDRR